MAAYEGVEQHKRPARSVRARFGLLGRSLVAATLARAADGGAAVGLLLLATSPATGVRNGAAVGGLLAAALTATHLLGPWVARQLYRAGDGRFVLAAACVSSGVALAAAPVLLRHGPLAAVVGAV